MSAPGRRTGVLLINLGTPAAPEVRAVRRYLREFLSDPRVIDLPRAARWLWLHAVILPFRPRQTARAYRKIWGLAGSPLLVNGRALREGVAKALGDDYVVKLAMRYQSPSIASALGELAVEDVERIVAIPLFPQYASAATGSALAELHARAATLWNVPVLETRRDFYDDPGFIGALAELTRPRLAEFRPDHVLFSYHGLPERQIRRSDASGEHCLVEEGCCKAVGPRNRHCYRAQCFATTRALATRLGLEAQRTTVAFQSRLGRTPWISPYTDRVLPDLARRGVRRLAVLCPSFVADCLETLEEIGIRGRAQWAALDGEELLLVPCLNAHPSWVETVASWVRQPARSQTAGPAGPRVR